MKRLKILLVLLFMSASSLRAEAAPNSWAKLAQEDLAAIKSELEENHPGAVDPLNPGFAKWLQEGYAISADLAKDADSSGGYYFALRRYVKGFNDAHLDIAAEVEKGDNLWPGFAVSQNENQFIVSELPDMGLKLPKPALPQPGDVLVGCDGKSVSELFASNVLPFYGVSGLAASDRINAPRLMFDEGNPYIERSKQCTFENQSGRYKHNLNWHSISSEQKEHIIRFVVRGKPPEIGLRQIKPGVFWIVLSSFGGNNLNPDQLHGVIKAASEQGEALRSSDVIVFDMRGNNGGVSTFGKDLLESIWGKGFVERLPGGGAEAVDWRASNGNILGMKEVRPQLVKVLTEDSDALNQMDDAIAGMEQARERGDNYYHKPIGLVSEEKAIRPGEVAPKIYLLSDGACASACLEFADWVLSIPNSELIGAQTSADTEYIGNRWVQLPSKKAWLSLSMSAYRGRVRGSNQPYRPTHQWNSKNWDTKELQDWVLELSR